MNRVEAGLRGEYTGSVGDTDTATFVGSGDVPVLATPRLIAWLEAAAVDCIAGRLPAGSTSVGTHITLDHLVATPVGRSVRAVAQVTEIDGPQIMFTVEAFDAETTVARGVHTRVVVDRDRFVARAHEKRS